MSLRIPSCEAQLSAFHTTPVRARFRDSYLKVIAGNFQFM
jgi:hypothetical protein